MIVCPVCKQSFSDAAIESHHVWPVAYGGNPEGIQVLLCGGCHSSIHQQAEILASGKSNRVMPDDNYERAKILIQAIMQAKVLYKESPSDSLERHKITISLTRETSMLLKQATKALGFKSTSAMLKTLIDRVIARALGTKTPN